MDKGKSLGEVLNCLKEEYLMSEREIKEDLLDLVKDLHKENLIEIIQ